MIDPASLVAAWLMMAAPAAMPAPPPAPMAAVSAVPQAPAAPEAPEAPPPGPAATPPETDRRTLKAFPANLAAAVVGIWSPDTVWPLAAGAALSGAAAPFDVRVRNRVAAPDAWFGKTFAVGGDSLVTTGGVVAAYVIGRITHDRKLPAAAYDMFEAALVTGALTTGLKYATHRERPDDSDHYSFPSGHTSNAFALATTLALHYGWKAAVPAYLGAALIAYSRIVNDKHYLSDVVAGAALGIIVARAVVRQNNRPRAGTAAPTRVSWSLTPVAVRRGGGLVLTLVMP